MGFNPIVVIGAFDVHLISMRFSGFKVVIDSTEAALK
jgi:hypothetical protein